MKEVKWGTFWLIFHIAITNNTEVEKEREMQKEVFFIFT